MALSGHVAAGRLLMQERTRRVEETTHLTHQRMVGPQLLWCTIFE